MGIVVGKGEFFQDDAKGKFVKSASIGLDGFSSVIRVDYAKGWVTYTINMENGRTSGHVYHLYN